MRRQSNPDAQHVALFEGVQRIQERNQRFVVEGARTPLEEQMRITFTGSDGQRTSQSQPFPDRSAACTRRSSIAAKSRWGSHSAYRGIARLLRTATLVIIRTTTALPVA